MVTNRLKVSEGDRYGDLVIIREVESRVWSGGGRKRYFLCRCDCGKEKVVRLTHMRNGHTRSCGCYVNPSTVYSTTHSVGYHGMKDSPEYGVWRDMKRRCYRPKARGYRNYGGRGIGVCERWRHSFLAFFEDMGSRPSSDHQIDRIDGDRDYEPGNCRWATRAEQNRNRRDNRYLEFNGEKLCLTDWAKRYGIHKGTLHDRLARGLSVREALTTPVRAYRSDDAFLRTPNSNRDHAWYREYARRKADG